MDKEKCGIVDDLITNMRKEMISLIDTPDKLIEFINANLKPKNEEKKQYGEVFTPLELVNKMLDKLPKEVWVNPDLKWFEPASGMGNFTICVYLRLLKTLRPLFQDEKATKKHILRKMLYMSELNPKNVLICRQIFGVDYLNLHEGNTLELDPKKEWGVKSFDIIMGNPPFQLKVGDRKTQPLWHSFVTFSLTILKPYGYLVYVHPSGWRSPEGVFKNVLDLIQSKNLKFLCMNSFKKGQEVFKVGTNFDYYVFQNSIDTNNITTIIDINGKSTVINRRKHIKSNLFLT